jgi:hypothetical protein
MKRQRRKRSDMRSSKITQRDQEKGGDQEASKRKKTLLICNGQTIVYLIVAIKQMY